MNNYQQLAKDFNCELGSNAVKIINRIEKRNGYCPCVVEENEDTICPCKKMREEKYCCCGLFIKENER